MIRAAVLGSPISHSLSPAIHNAAYSLLNIEGQYTSFEVTENELSDFLMQKKKEGWDGFSLTMPLKDSIFSAGLPIEFDPISRSIKSANTIYDLQSNPKTTSTDFTAFQRLLTPRIERGTRVNLLGGGGTARAALGALKESSPRISVYLRGGGISRRASELRELFPTLDFTFKTFGDPLTDAELLINTTPAGSADIYAPSELGGASILFESLYKPWPTALAASATERNLHVISGKELLVEQALDQIHLMTGKSFDFDLMREKLLGVI